MCLAKVFQWHKFEPEVEFISSNSSSSNNSNSENEDFIICHDKLLLDCYNTIVNKTLGRALDPHSNGAWLSKTNSMKHEVFILGG